MKYLFDEYGQTFLSLFISIGIITTFICLILVEVLNVNVKAIENETNNKLFIEETIPVKIDNFVCTDAVIKKGYKFNYQNYTHATNSNDDDISSYITLYEDIDTSEEDEKEAIYILRYNGEKMVGKAKVIIENEEYD